MHTAHYSDATQHIAGLLLLMILVPGVLSLLVARHESSLAGAWIDHPSAVRRLAYRASLLCLGYSVGTLGVAFLIFLASLVPDSNLGWLLKPISFVGIDPFFVMLPLPLAFGLYFVVARRARKREQRSLLKSPKMAAPEAGPHGLWTLPDGRVIFYPQSHNTHGYLVETARQERRIRLRGRVYAVAGFIAVVPVVVAARLLDSTPLLLVAVMIGFAVEYWIGRFLARGLAVFPEPMSPLRRLRLRASQSSAASNIALAAIFGVLAIAMIPMGLHTDELLAGFVLSASCALGSFAAAYTWHIKRSMRI